MELIITFLVTLLFFLSLIGAIAGIARFCNSNYRPAVFATLSMLLLTPSLAPATIVSVPVPFGAIIVIGVLAGAVPETPGLVSLFWRWYIVAFPLTWVLCYLLYVLAKKCFFSKEKT